GLPLMLLHGYPLDHTIWDNLIPHCHNDFDLILPDLRGFGKSPGVEAIYSMESFADDLKNLLDKLKIERTYLAGHSMGGYVALSFAEKYPDKVLGLAMVASQAGEDSPEAKSKRYLAVEDVQKNGVGNIADQMSLKLSANDTSRKFLHKLILSQNKSGVIGALRAMAERKNLFSVLTNSTFPVILIHGDADILIPVEKSLEMNARSAKSFLSVISGSGHMPMMDEPKKVAEAFRMFLR
ncbi:MAG TPA: alpha/beta hydrolase, partial [Bacteroidia bacterium]|nr:alpha/beta hydrolase [Bacteroidia bacterium]